MAKDRDAKNESKETPDNKPQEKKTWVNSKQEDKKRGQLLKIARTEAYITRRKKKMVKRIMQLGRPQYFGHALEKWKKIA